MSTQEAPQAVIPVEHNREHRPALQNELGRHSFPQSPQLNGSVWVFEQAPAHSSRGGSQEVIAASIPPEPASVTVTSGSPQAIPHASHKNAPRYRTAHQS